MRQHPPGTARPAQVENRVENLPHIDRTGAAAGFGFGDLGFDAFPLRIGQVAGIKGGGHGSNLREREKAQLLQRVEYLVRQLYGRRSPDEYYHYARDEAKLDFCALTDAVDQVPASRTGVLMAYWLFSRK